LATGADDVVAVQGMDVARIAKVTFTSPDRVREVVNNFNEDGFESLYPKYAGGRPPTFTLPQRQQIKKIALSRPADHGLPFSTWKQSNDPDFEVKKNRVLELYDIAEGKAKPRKGDLKVVLSVDEFGPLNLLPRPGQLCPDDRRAPPPRPAAVDGGQRTNGPRAYATCSGRST
jgi:hypothetical protein